MLRNGAAYVWDDEMKVPYAIHGDQWVGFDDEKSIRHKMRFVKLNFKFECIYLPEYSTINSYDKFFFPMYSACMHVSKVLI